MEPWVTILQGNLPCLIKERQLSQSVYSYHHHHQSIDRSNKLSLFFVCYIASWPGSDTKDMSGAAPKVQGARYFPYSELKQASNNFSESNEIGSGGYGKVCIHLFMWILERNLNFFCVISLNKLIFLCDFVKELIFFYKDWVRILTFIIYSRYTSIYTDERETLGCHKTNIF